MKLRPYQNSIVDQIVNSIGSVLVQAPTGSGKTVMFSALIQKWLELNPTQTIIVSVHREELVEQTHETLKSFGVDSEPITAKRKYNLNRVPVLICMTQTLYSRQIIPPNVGLLIVDEAHEQIHKKTFDFFPTAKRVGFSATPIINERLTYYQCESCRNIYPKRVECCHGEEAEKWSRPITMSEFYDSIILGPSIKSLINEGSLIQEVVFKYNYYSELTDIEDENQIAEESIKHDQNVLDEYIQKANGKKTMIFTASTKQNPSLVQAFSGYPIKAYDSVHNHPTERKAMVEWFRKTPGAILVSTGTFTTGFDVREVEAIIINRPTKSLSLFLQMVGRGARPSDIIFKDQFIVTDLGGNVDRFNQWSSDRDWTRLFKYGLNPAKKAKETLIQCDSCGFNWMGTSLDPCAECGNYNKAVKSTSNSVSNTEDYLHKSTELINKIVMPNAVKIREFVERTNGGKPEYWNIIIDRYIDLWKFNGDKQTYLNRIKTKTLEPKIQHYIKDYYFQSNKLIGKYRTNSYLSNRTKIKLDKLYDNI